MDISRRPVNAGSRGRKGPGSRGSTTSAHIAGLFRETAVLTLPRRRGHSSKALTDVGIMEPTQRSALARLLNGLKREQHDYRPSLEVFPALNIEKLAADMGLATAGAERGTREEPAADGIALDDVENRIIERVEAEKNAAHGLLLDELSTYKERLSSLDFEGRFATIRQAAPRGRERIPR